MRKLFAVSMCLFMLLIYFPVQAERQPETNINPEFKYSLRDVLLKDFQEKPIKEVLEKGESVPYLINIDNKEWKRPIYSSVWDTPYYKGRYAGSPLVFVDMALHSLFQSPVGASAEVDFYVPLGLPEAKGTYSVEDKFPQHLGYSGYYILNAKVKEVKKLGEQVAIVAEPTRTGYQEIWIKLKDLPSKVLFHLVTPDGYEMDYLPIPHLP